MRVIRALEVFPWLPVIDEPLSFAIKRYGEPGAPEVRIDL